MVKHLDDGDQLLVKNEIELLRSESLHENDLQSIIKQNPNTKLLVKQNPYGASPKVEKILHNKKFKFNKFCI